MPESSSTQNDTWNVLLIEDDDTVRRQVREYLEQESFASRKLNITDIADINQALNIIRERKADLVILDVYRGTAQKGGEQIGIRVLESIKRSGFVPVVLYTALPEGLESQIARFVRLVSKDAGGLERLKNEITELFRIRIPQIHRAVVNQLDHTLSSYMWEFVQTRWDEFEPFIEDSEFLRLIVQRLVMTFTHGEMDSMIEEVYGTPKPDQPNEEDCVHPALYYIKPPIGQNPELGDIRLRQSSATKEYLVVLWPSCDMVLTKKRKPKTEYVLCVIASLAKGEEEIQEWVNGFSATKQEKVERLINNTRNTKGKSPDRYHFLPGIWDIPDLVVDFQKLEHVGLDDIRKYNCIATLASPFAEAFAARFQRYIGRLGTPDINTDAVLSRMKQASES